MGRVTDEIKKRKAVHSFRIGIIDATIGTLKVSELSAHTILTLTISTKSTIAHPGKEPWGSTSFHM